MPSLGSVIRPMTADRAAGAGAGAEPSVLGSAEGATDGAAAAEEGEAASLWSPPRRTNTTTAATTTMTVRPAPPITQGSPFLRDFAGGGPKPGGGPPCPYAGAGPRGGCVACVHRPPSHQRSIPGAPYGSGNHPGGEGADTSDTLEQK